MAQYHKMSQLQDDDRIERQVRDDKHIVCRLICAAPALLEHFHTHAKEEKVNSVKWPDYCELRSRHPNIPKSPTSIKLDASLNSSDRI